MGAARLGLLAAACILAGALFWLGAVPAVADSCPNAQLRTGYSASLPDCRAYEQVSPVDKGDNGIEPAPILATADGGSVVYTSPGVFAGAPSSVIPDVYTATRNAGGWPAKPLSLAQAPSASLFSAPTLAVSGDLMKSFVQTNAVLAPGADQLNENLYKYDSSDGSVQLVATVPNELYPTNPSAEFDIGGASGDGTRFVFQYLGGRLPSTPAPDASANFNVYTFADAQLKLDGILPNGDPDPRGSVLAAPSTFFSTVFRAVSSDGSRVYWHDGSSESPPVPVYVRDGDQTKLVSADQSGTPQPARFWYASKDGSVAYLTTFSKLTNPASASTDLYRYDAASDQLTDLTPASADPNGADVQGVLGTSEDGSYVYFIANGVLAPGASAGDCAIGSGECNLYVWHDGTTRFIDRLASGASEILGSLDNPRGWRISPDGKWLALLFSGELAGPHPEATQPHDQAYLYSYEADSLACASCLPGGAPPGGDATLQGKPIGATAVVLEAQRVQSRNIADSGRFFFNSPDALVPGDTNGEYDVYEYESGQVHLISTGRSDQGSYFADASTSGDDAFFTTDQPLVGQDADPLVDLYDARVGGGIASQNAMPPPPPCSGDACRDTSSAAPATPVAASVTFGGPGDASPAAATAKVKLLTRTVRGSSFPLRVSVSAQGRITITGAGIKAARRSVTKRGTYRLRVRLTAREKQLVKRRHKVKLKLRVAFAPTLGASSHVTISITDKA